MTSPEVMIRWPSPEATEAPRAVNLHLRIALAHRVAIGPVSGRLATVKQAGFCKQQQNRPGAIAPLKPLQGAIEAARDGRVRRNQDFRDIDNIGSGKIVKGAVRPDPGAVRRLELIAVRRNDKRLRPCRAGSAPCKQIPIAPG